MISKSILEKIPNKPGIYIWKNKNKVLYIGKAKNLKKRLEQYFRIGNLWKEDMVSKATDIDWILTKNEQEALVLESNLIKKYQPPYNSLLKGDNHYTYIRIGTGTFPKIEFTRFKDKEGTYIGPKAWKKELKDIFQILKRILKFRTCSDTKFKKGQLCSEYTLGLCKGWCCNLMNSEEGIMNNKDEYNKIIKVIKDFFNGDTKSVKNLIKEKINQAIKEENFEYAQILKNIYFKIDKFEQNQFVELNKNINGYFIKIKEYKGVYFMIYVKISDGKIIDIIKLSDTENNFIKTMKNEGLIKEVKKLGENFYFAK